MMSINQKDVSERITYLMFQMKLNQQQFADLLGVTQPAVSKYLKERIPPAPVLLKLAHAASTTIEWILSGDKVDSRQKVAEPFVVYSPPLSIEQKFRQLPFSLQKQFDRLLDSILKNLKTGSD